MKKRWFKSKTKSCKDYKYHTCGGGFYFLGFLGALIYYLSIATSFWTGVLGVLKSFVWPVFLVLELLKFIGA